MRRTVLTALGLTGLLLPLGAVATPAQAAATCDGRAATISAVVAVPTTGTPGDDVIVGTEVSDVIDGAGGNDTICGLEGADTITGGTGDDRLFGGLDAAYEPDDGYGGDLLVPGPGDDHVDLGDDPDSADIYFADAPGDYDRVSFRDAPGPVVVDLAHGTASGEGVDTIAAPRFSGGIVGSAHDDTLAGSSGHDWIQAGGGDDRVTGRNGDDEIDPDRVGSARHEAAHPAGDDVVFGGDGEDVITAVLGQDHVRGDAEGDYIRAAGAGTTVQGGGGADVIEGRAGVDIRAGDGPDAIESHVGGRTRHVADGGRGVDVLALFASRSKFEHGSRWLVDVPRERILVDRRKTLVYRAIEGLGLTAPGGRLTFRGGPGRDGLSVPRAMRLEAYGGRGPDTFTGGKFGDRLVGGPGRDLLIGNEGRDRCLEGERLKSCEVRH